MKKSHDAALRTVGIKQEKEGGKLKQTAQTSNTSATRWADENAR